MNINNFKIQFSNIEQAMNAAKMFELRQKAGIAILEGKCREARTAQKEFAKLAVADFDTFTKLPHMNIHGVSPRLFFPMLLKSLKFKLFSLFSKLSPEEKLLRKQYQAYVKNVTKEDIAKKTIDVTIPSLY